MKLAVRHAARCGTRAWRAGWPVATLWVVVAGWLAAVPCVRAVGQATTPVVLWQQPTPIPFLTPLSGVQLDAMALSGPPVAVPLAGSANVTGITTAGFSSVEGFDGNGYAWAEESIGSSVAWQGIQFPIGVANQNDAVAHATVSLPAGGFGTLLMLGAMVNNISPSIETFTVTYTDGSTTTVQQGMSDWVNPRNYPGETLVQCYPYRHINLTIDRNSVCVYGYSITLDPTKTVKSLQLPATRDIVMLSFELLPPAVQGSMTYNPAAGAMLPSGTNPLDASFAPANTAAYTTASASVALTVTPLAARVLPTIAWPVPAPIIFGTSLGPTQLDARARVAYGPILIPIVPTARVNAVYADGSQFNAAGFDGKYAAYSSNQLGSSLEYAGFTFPLGPAGIPDAATSGTIPLPAGSFSTLYLLGAGANGSQADQVFTVSYADGSTSTGKISLSSWDQPVNFPGETIVAQTKYANTSAGSEVSGTFDVYGYQVPIDATKVVKSLTLPPTTDVVVLALGLGTDTTTEPAGNYAFNPGSGTVLPLGTNPLSVSFTPADSTDLAPATATNSIVVVKPTLTVTANDATRLYGVANPVFTGSITGQLYGDTFTESFTTTAGTTSPAGSYSIAPVAVGSDLAAYQETIVDGTLTVAKAPVTLSVTSNVSTIMEGQTAILTATVASTTSGTPTGTVQFLSNGSSIATVPVANGSALLSTAALPIGSDAITVVYSGDQDFLGATATAVVSIIVTSPDFTFQALQGTTISDTWGQSGSVKLHVAPISTVYYANVTFSVPEGLLPFATASFSPAVVIANAGPQDVVLTYNSHLLSLLDSGKGISPLIPAVCGLMMVPLAMLRKRRRGARLLAGLLAAVALVPMLNGCGSGYRTGAYPLMVTATDGEHQHSLTITVDLRAP